MYYWLATMCHPDGNISYFNDSTLGVAATLSEVQEYATRLTLRSEVPATSNCISLSESGYYRVSSGNSKFLIDVGKIGPSYQPGHGHADILSFEMSVGNKRCIVNRGVSTYASGPLRLAQRGSVSHSTILLEGKKTLAMCGLVFELEPAQSRSTPTYLWERIIFRKLVVHTLDLEQNVIERGILRRTA